MNQLLVSISVLRGRVYRFRKVECGASVTLIDAGETYKVFIPARLCIPIQIGIILTLVVYATEQNFEAIRLIGEVVL